MKELLDKLSSYNIFNYLFPGTLFAVIADLVTKFHFKQDDIITGAFLYYFYGLVISRIGSIIIEPILKKFNFIRYSDYNDFVNASKKDPKIDILLEASNTYRTLAATASAILFLMAIDGVEGKCQLIKEHSNSIALLALFLLFCYSFRKQTDYITKRVKASKEAEATKEVKND